MATPMDMRMKASPMAAATGFTTATNMIGNLVDKPKTIFATFADQFKAGIPELGVHVGIILIFTFLGLINKYATPDGDKNLSIIDSLYKSTVTSSTVGYGDIYPKTGFGRLLDYAQMALVMLIGSAIGFGDKVDKFGQTVKGVTFDMKGAVIKLVANVVLNIVFGLIYALVNATGDGHFSTPYDEGKGSFLDMLWFGQVAGFTVGYGDFYPLGTFAKIINVIHIIAMIYINVVF